MTDRRWGRVYQGFVEILHSLRYPIPDDVAGLRGELRPDAGRDERASFGHGRLVVGGMDFKVTPFLTAWSSKREGFAVLAEGDWIQIGLHIDSVDLYAIGPEMETQYFEGAGAFACRLMRALLEIDPDSPVRFLADIGDPDPWPWEKPAVPAKWVYTLALVPHGLAHDYSNAPPTHVAESAAEGLWIGAKYCWENLPW